MSDMDGFLDDEVAAAQAARRKRGPIRRNDIPRVVDGIGDKLAITFQDFLEKYAVYFHSLKRTNYFLDMSKNLPPLDSQCRVPEQQSLTSTT